MLDGFFQAVPIAEKQRVHFHDFFTHLHQGMFRHREAPDALGQTLDELLKDCRLLCFDEFHVHDIGDAMLINRLFKALFQRGVLLLVTSNYPPEGLLPNPLYHARFKPVIDLINARMEVMEVGGPHDYRSQPRSHDQQQFTLGQYVWPGTPAQRQTLQLPQRQAPAFALQVGARQLKVRLCSERTVRFEFADLCDQPTAVMDYLELCRRFDTWIVDELPRLEGLLDRGPAALYQPDRRALRPGQAPVVDRRTAAARQPRGGNAIDLARTRSRLGQLVEVGPESLNLG